MTPRRFNLVSLTTLAFLFSLVLGVFAVVVVAVAWIILNHAGVFSNLQQVTARTPGLETFDVYDVVGLDRVLMVVAMLGAIGLVVVPVAAFLCGAGYNVISRRVGAPLR